VDAIRDACRTLNLASLPMISRAYHDSLFMARVAPTGMIFIPCKDGISHRPEEFSTPEAIARGIEILAMTLARLAGMDGGAHGVGDVAR
jgi:ureidoglycolate amidohydrolase